MKNLKKTINKIKTDNFLEKFPIVFLLQHTNFSVNDWFDLKKKMGEISDETSSIEILMSKNNVLKQSFSPEISKSFKILLQGPNFLIGCQNENHCKLIWNYVQSNPKLIFISCMYRNQTLNKVQVETTLNHLDLKKFFKLNSSVYHDLLFLLDKKIELNQLLEHHLTLHPLILRQQNLITCLNMLKVQ